MIRRLNYTNRLKIDRSSVAVKLIKLPGQPLSFSTVLRLDKYNLPLGANVYVEAYKQTLYTRFSFGTVGMIRPPDSRWLREYDSDSILFRVKIVDNNTAKGKLLAEADRIFPLTPEEESENQIVLLYVRSANLRDQVWNLDLSDDIRIPILQISDKISDRNGLVRSDRFSSLVFPQIVRQILTQILLIEDPETETLDLEDWEDWRSLWLRYAAGLPGAGEAPLDQPDNKEAQIGWIDNAVGAFCSYHQCLARHLKMEPV